MKPNSASGCACTTYKTYSVLDEAPFVTGLWLARPDMREEGGRSSLPKKKKKKIKKIKKMKKNSDEHEKKKKKKHTHTQSKTFVLVY